MGVTFFKKLFNPEVIGIIGNFSSSYCSGNLFIKNIQSSNVSEIYKLNKDNLKNFKKNLDLLIVTLPLKEIPDVIDNLSHIKIENMLISSGRISIDDDFYEGLIIEKLKKRNIKLIGFRSFGFVANNINLNVSQFDELPEKGEIALISQSGAIINTIIELTKGRKIGFSYLIDLGTLAGIDFGDAIDYLAYQPDVKCVLLFVVSLKNPRKFLSAVRAVAKFKPIIVLKIGKSPTSIEIIKFHTGKLPGNDFVYDNAFRRAGAVRVNDLAELIFCGDILSKNKIYYGEKLAVISNSRTANIFVTDILHEKGLKLVQPTKELSYSLKELLHEQIEILNPLDLTMEADDNLIIEGVKKLFFSEEFQTIMLILVLNKKIDPVNIIKETKKFMEKFKKCKIIYILIGKPSCPKREIMSLQGDDALIFFNLIYAINFYYHTIRYYRSIEKLYAFTPSFDKTLNYDKNSAEKYIEELINSEKLVLSDSESKKLLNFYGIETHPTYIVRDFNEAKKVIEKIGYPVVLKTDEFIKGVKGYKYINDDETLKLYIEKLLIYSSTLNIQKMVFDIDFEFRIGVETDIEFGPYIYLSFKGGWEKRIMLPPLNRFLAQRLIYKFNEFEELKKKGLIDVPKLEEILVRLSFLICNHSEISNIVIDPVILSEKKFYIVNSFIKLKPTEVKAPSHLSIRPYPSEYEFWEKLPDGTEIFIRPIRPEDEPMHLEFFYSLSRETQYYRFFTYTSKITHEQIAMFTHVDYDREIAIIAIIKENGKEKIIGVNRLTFIPYENRYEFAIVVTDAWQGKGVAKILMEKLFYIAKDRKIKRIYGTVLAENRRMLNFVKKFGFKVIGFEGDTVYIMVEL